MTLMNRVNNYMDHQGGKPQGKINTSILVFSKFIIRCLMMWHKVRFPERVTGGDWWVCRWRLNFLLGWNEAESVALCYKFIRPGMAVLDIGAHLGYYTRIFSRLVGKEGIVYAFEPCPENIPVLKYNLSHRRYRNVKIVEKAVSSQNGTATLFVSPGHSMHSLNSGYTEEQGRIDVETIALDDFLLESQANQVGFVKIDVEGAEPLVFQGMQQIVRRSPRLAMLVEYNPDALRAGGFEPMQMLADLSAMGFAFQRVFADGSLGTLDASCDDLVNLLCVRSMNDFP